MWGMASMNIQTDTTSDPSSSTRCGNAFGSLGLESGASVLQSLIDGHIELTEASNIEPDYDPLYPLLAHPTVFINGDGECPVGMSESEWVKYVLRRPPLIRTGRPEWILAENNRQQRHRAYKEAHTQLYMTPENVRRLSTLNDDIAGQVAAMYRQDRGPPRAAALAKAPEAVKALFSSVRFAAGRMQNGSPDSIARLRSESAAANLLWGEDTLWITINPSETHSKITLQLAGADVEYAAWDPNSAHPTMAQIKEQLANHPSAAEEYAYLYINAFFAIFCGWPIGSDRQVNPGCHFGLIKFYDLRFETEGRGNIHGHAGVKGCGNARYIFKVRFLL